MPKTPYKLTPARQRAYLRELERGSGRHAAARTIGLAPSTISRFARAHPEFADRVGDAEMLACDQLVNVLWRAAEDGDVGAAKFLLANRAGWSTSTRVSVVAHSSVDRVEHAPYTALERLEMLRALEVAGAKPAGSANAFEAFLRASGELPVAVAPALELVDAVDVEVVDDVIASS